MNTMKRLNPLLSSILLLASCGDGPADTGEVPAELAVCAPESGPFSLVIDNPYYPLVVGAVREVGGLEAGTDPSRHVLTVLDETTEIFGVATRVVNVDSYEGAGEDEFLVEVAREYYAQAPDGTVCLFGEDEAVYRRNGSIRETDAWRAGQDGRWAGVAMPGSIAVGQMFTRGIDGREIEISEVTSIGESTTTPAGTFADSITVLEEGPSIKKYARDIGEIYDDGLELLSYE